MTDKYVYVMKQVYLEICMSLI